VGLRKGVEVEVVVVVVVVVGGGGRKPCPCWKLNPGHCTSNQSLYQVLLDHNLRAMKTLNTNRWLREKTLTYMKLLS